MSSKRDTIVADVDSLPRDDLLDLYEKLAESYRQLKEENEENKQQFHYHKQQSKILQRSQNDIQSELEGLNEAHKKELEEIMKANSSAIEGLKKAKQENESDKIYLETKVDDLSRKLKEQENENEELKEKLSRKIPKPRISDSFTLNLEVEIESLRRELAEVHGKFEEATQQSLAKDLMLEELREKILCLEDNLESKKSEVDEKNETMESLQEQLNDLTVEIAMLKSAPDDANRKGNSLFAEVDDQRQKMKSILQGERAHYNDMKKLFNSKEMEIRRLKRENRNIKTEIQTCSGLLQRGEQIEVQTLNSQVTYLHNENRKLVKELAEMEKKLIDLAKEQNLGWVESLMTSATYETRDLKDKLMRVMMEKASLVDNFAKAQRELAKARLDCVKLKILLGRIVDFNGIKINAHDFIDIGVDQEVLENLKIEELEPLDEPSFSADDNDAALNESTIILLGGHQRLGNLVPPAVTPEKLRCESKENLIQPAFAKIPFSPHHQPLKTLQICQESPKNDEEKSVKFSSVVETKVIDKTPEDFERSKLARKRNPIIVKRIVISSKAVVKKEE